MPNYLFKEEYEPEEIDKRIRIRPKVPFGVQNSQFSKYRIQAWKEDLE